MDRTAGLCCKQQVQHRHEVRLAGTEAAVQVARLAVGRIDRRLDEAQSVVEAGDQLRRDDVLIERLLGLGDAFGQVENEVAFANLLRQDQQFADELFHRRIPGFNQTMTSIAISLERFPSYHPKYRVGRRRHRPAKS